MTWFQNTRYGSLTGSHAQITHMMWRQSVHVIQKSGMQVLYHRWAALSRGRNACVAGTALAVSFGDAFSPGSLLRSSGLMACANAGGSSPPSPREGWARHTGSPGSGARTPSGCQLWAKEVPGTSGLILLAGLLAAGFQTIDMQIQAGGNVAPHGVEYEINALTPRHLGCGNKIAISSNHDYLIDNATVSQ